MVLVTNLRKGTSIDSKKMKGTGLVTLLDHPTGGNRMFGKI